MEVFSGDHHHGLPTDVILYPDTHLSPFTLPPPPPPTTDSFSDHHHFLPPHPPPQKLRPIRCGNGRSFSAAECCSSDEPKPPPPPLSWQPETGFFHTAGFIPPKEPANLASSSFQTQPALSSSSDESTKLQEEAVKEPATKKRKRKSRKKLESFIESMMKTVMEKQEEMHKQLIEILDKKENERIKREEAWKKKEMERAKRDEEARSQEISRSLALISFIQNSLGQEIQIPNPFNNKQNENQNENQNEETFKCDTGNDTIEESENDQNVKRWPKSEVQALITVRAALNQKFNHKGPKGSIWEEVAGGLSRMGYNRTPKKCKEKWENINKYYRRTMDKGKESGGRNSQTWSYFSELEMLYKTGFISGNEDPNTKESH